MVHEYRPCSSLLTKTNTRIYNQHIKLTNKFYSIMSYSNLKYHDVFRINEQMINGYAFKG